MTTPNTLAKLAADLEQLASEGPELIHTQSGAYISQKLSEAAKAIAAQATTGGGVTTGAPSEPFGYFKAEPFGWTDCAETDDGAVALYEGPASQFTGAFSGIAARKLADLADRGYRVNGYSLMHAETRARGFIDSYGFVGWWSNRDHEQAALAHCGRCDECGKDQADGWALYCVGCLEKTGLLAKEALPSAQHVSSTAADLTGPNDTAAQATTGAPSEYSQWAGRPTVLENAIAHIDAQALRLEAAERDAVRLNRLLDAGRCDSKHGAGFSAGTTLRSEIEFRYWVPREIAIQHIDAAIASEANL